MGKLRLVPPDGADWTIDAVSAPDGVDFAIASAIEGAPITARFVMDRPEVHRLSDGLLTAAGDGMRRTFPKPAEGGHG
ncbi:hypothetical protein [Methylobacterium sp. E-046]|uniref:hypothetical protein n=1 Tax=Methylobacterium sp. E-046 TaxID=2836576 RepID=UPI001FBB3BA8|nr:hypothetical protein [Methylobacterium sp. E-046]MCJ2098480.1 hypothetical protein [Methylobacterium sp. E-046]